MRPAPAIGVSLEGEREPSPDTQAKSEDSEAPWRARVAYGEAVLGCRWPSSASALRGAVVAALGERAHVDHHNHLDDGTTRQARATVMYRVRDEGRHRRPVVWAYGPRVLDHLAAIARIRALRAPGGGVYEVDSAEVETTSVMAGQYKDRWHRYELVTPYFCPSVVYDRRPRVAGIEQDAWAGQAIAGSVRAWLLDLGIDVPVHRPVHVQIVNIVHERIAWRGQAEFARSGFRARFVSNAILPPGLGIGQHVSEGWGEVRPWG